MRRRTAWATGQSIIEYAGMMVVGVVLVGGLIGGSNHVLPLLFKALATRNEWVFVSENPSTRLAKRPPAPEHGKKPEGKTDVVQVNSPQTPSQTFSQSGEEPTADASTVQSGEGVEMGGGSTKAASDDFPRPPAEPFQNTSFLNGNGYDAPAPLDY